jgi:hypothetical protein
MKTFLILILYAASGEPKDAAPLAQTASEEVCQVMAAYINQDPQKEPDIRAVCVRPPVGASTP